MSRILTIFIILVSMLTIQSCSIWMTPKKFSQLSDCLAVGEVFSDSHVSCIDEKAYGINYYGGYLDESDLDVDHLDWCGGGQAKVKISCVPENLLDLISIEDRYYRDGSTYPVIANYHYFVHRGYLVGHTSGLTIILDNETRKIIGWQMIPKIPH